MKPHSFPILAVDPGATSGAAFWDGSMLWKVKWGPVQKLWVPELVIEALQIAVEDVGKPLVMVGETWGRGGARGIAQWQGLGAAWKQWDWALDDAWEQLREQGYRSPAPKRCRVHVSTWRSKVFGGRVGKDMAKKLAVVVANREFGLKLTDDQHDGAEAACILKWALHAPEVAAVVPKKWRE